MSDKLLRLQVVFGAIDKLSAPLRQLAAGSKGLSRSIAQTQKQIAGLKKAQLQLAQYKGAEGRFQKSSAELEQLRARTAAVRAEIAQVEAPTKKMAAALKAAEKAEAAAIDRHEEHGRKLQGLSRGLEAAGVDVTQLARHEDNLARQLRESNQQLDAQRAKLERVQRIKRRGEAIRGAGGRVTGAGAMMTVGVTAPVVAAVSASIPEAIAARKATADVQAALASMGPKAGRSLEQLDEQAERLQSNSLFDDDDIMKQVTANMLTFGKVSGAVFDRAQLAAVNLTARLGGDLQSRAIMVGKALQDPVKGITALGRAGVSLDDKQKKQIKTWVKTGQLAKAQSLILGELEKQYGGAAAAARAADSSGAMQQDWRAFQEDVGESALVILPALASALKTVSAAFSSLTTDQRKYLVLALIAAAALGPLLTVLGGLIAAIGWLFPLLMKLGLAFKLFTGFTSLLGRGILLLGGAFLRAGAMMLANPIVLIIAGIVAAVGLLAYAAYKIYQNWAPIAAWFSGLWRKITSGVSQAWTFIKSAFATHVQWLLSLGATFASIGANLFRGLVNGMLGALGWVKDSIVGAGQKVIGWFKGVLGIRSPSRVFAQLGGHIMGGLTRGLDRGVDGPLARIRKAGGELTSALAGSVLLAAPAAGASLPPPGAPPPRGPASYTFNIYPQPGQDPRAIAEEIRKELDRRERQNGANRRSSFEDQD